MAASALFFKMMHLSSRAGSRLPASDVLGNGRRRAADLFVNLMQTENASAQNRCLLDFLMWISSKREIGLAGVPAIASSKSVGFLGDTERMRYIESAVRPFMPR